MPLIHFAFGRLHRSGNYEEQVARFVEDILGPRKLRAFQCPEFLPLLSNPNALMADPNSARATGDGGVTWDKYVPPPPVQLLPVDVWMTSFVDIPIKKLRGWAPSSHYGKLGIAFTDAFRARNGVRRVSYYRYPRLEKDPFVIRLNQAMAKKDQLEVHRLHEIVVNYRKPAKLWPEFNNLFVMMKITSKEAGDVDIEKIPYSRYDVGYDFEQECEGRLVTPESARDIAFKETDVLAIIVPDKQAKALIEDHLAESWRADIDVYIYPT